MALELVSYHKSHKLSTLYNSSLALTSVSSGKLDVASAMNFFEHSPQ